MARILLLGLLAAAAVGAGELARWLVLRGWGGWALFGLLPVGLWILEILYPGNQFGLGPLVETRADWALEGAIVGFFVLPVMVGYAIGLVIGFVGRRRMGSDE
ncbi:MAG: hypothetical protein AAFN59_08495 [Pseudomonadota bacterium]